MKKIIIKIKTAAIFLLTSLALASLTGCLDELNLTQYEISGIEANKNYVGLAYEPPPAPTTVPQLPEYFSIEYSHNHSNIPVYLNGQTVSAFLEYSANSARLEFARVAEFLRQGENVISVAPLSFGPQLRFGFDNAGPLLDVDKLEQIGDAYQLSLRVDDGANIDELYIQEMSYQWDGGVDNSQYTSFKTSTQTPIGEKTFFSQSNDDKELWHANNLVSATAKMYRIYARDEYGYETEDYYLAPGEKINNVFKLRLDKKVLDTVVPMAEANISYMHIYAPKALANMGKSIPSDPDAEPADTLDIMSRFWSRDGIFYGDTGNGAKTNNPADCGYIETNNWDASDQGVYFDCTSWDGSNCNSGDWVIPSHIAHKTGECSKIIMYRTELGEASDLRFTLKDGANNQGVMDLNIKLRRGNKSKALWADLGIKHVKCGKQSEKYGGFLGIGAKTRYFTDHYCRITGDAKAGLGLVSLGDLKVEANEGNPSGGVKVLIKDGDLDLDLPGMKLNLSGLKIGSGLDGIIGLISGLLDGMFVDIVKGVIKANLPEFILGADFYTEWDATDPKDPSLQVQSHAYQVWTNADSDPNNELEWYMYYAGFFRSLKEHPDLENKVLGSRYVLEPVMPPVTTNADIDMAININIINQALMSFYRSGISHITVTSNKHVNHEDKETNIFFGPNITDGYNFSNNEKRVQLIPRTPGVLQMADNANGTHASLYYRNAKMLIETFKDGQWETNFTVEVDLQLGVLMEAKDGNFYIKVLGIPKLEIKQIALGDSDDWVVSNEKGNMVFTMGNNVIKNTVQLLVDGFMSLAIPQLSEEVGELQYPGIPIPETTNGIFMQTRSISANNNRHLSFGLEMEERECELEDEEAAVCSN